MHSSRNLLLGAVIVAAQAGPAMAESKRSFTSAAPVHIGGGGELMLNPSPLGRINGSRANPLGKWSPKNVSTWRGRRFPQRVRPASAPSESFRE